MRTYTREQWFEECRQHQPDLDRSEFDAQWETFWTIMAMVNGWETIP